MALSLLGFSAALAGVPAPALPLPASATISARQTGMVVEVEGEWQTSASASVAWGVLTHYARFPEFVPGISSIRVEASKSGGRIVTQRGEILAGQLRMAYEGVMQVTEVQGERVNILFVSGPFKDVQGAWHLSAGQPLKLSYSMRMDLMKTPFPPPMAASMAQQQVTNWVAAMAQEIERTMARNGERHNERGSEPLRHPSAPEANAVLTPTPKPARRQEK